MTEFPRYAIYYTPVADSTLTRFGAELLSYDAFTGGDVAVPADVLAQAPDWPMLIRDPRKYGFHATLKAPFPLALHATEIELIAACEAFVAASRAIPVITPVVRTIGGFTAIVPDAPVDALNDLAAVCVRTFENFRAPMSAEDRARRKPEALTARQADQLDRWGYPYVFDDYQFHMTLTGRLVPERQATVRDMLAERFATLGLATLPIDRIGLFKQDSATARFRALRSYALIAG